jgi:hypothetical protein
MVVLLAWSRRVGDTGARWPHLLQTAHPVRGHGPAVAGHLGVRVALILAVLLPWRGPGVRLELHLLLLLHHL